MALVAFDAEAFRPAGQHPSYRRFHMAIQVAADGVARNVEDEGRTDTVEMLALETARVSCSSFQSGPSKATFCPRRSPPPEDKAFKKETL